MLRAYCDSNVFRMLVPTHPSHTAELHSVFESLKDKLLFCFSEAHMDDLKNSKDEFRRKDLAFMRQYVRDNYLAYDPIIDKALKYWLTEPQEAFDNIDYAGAKTAIATPFDLTALTKDMEDMPGVKAMVKLLDNLLDMPIVGLTPTIDAFIMDSKSKAMMDKMIPGYRPTMSIRELMNGILPFGIALLEDDKQVTELRNYIGEYLDREVYSFDKWGLDFNERFKTSTFGKTFLQTIEFMLTDKQKDDFYLRFSYTYTGLEILNITREKKSGGRGTKKFNFDSLHTDGLHAYYGSFCDYLVTDDKGLQVKANIVYQLFGFRTKVLSTKDFINLKTQLLGQEETYEKLIDTLKFDVNHSLQLREAADIATGTKFKTYKTSHTYFNYFNRMQTIDDPETGIVLYCERGPSQRNSIMYREIELLVNKMVDTFGLDDKKFGFYNLSESNKMDKEHTIRGWTKGPIAFTFKKMHNESMGLLLCLFIDFIKQDYN